MSNRITTKETLAKLMASENIFVEHANVPTAGFDLINRRLLLPNWKNISDDVYTLLISHEVGHALFTPKEQWEEAIMKEKNMSFKQVVNIVEDVRIEKMIQQKYPGTVRAFKSGYNELEQSNLFGTKDRDINSYGLLDRLNVHFKIGHFGYAKVPFFDNERVWLDRINSCKSFADVLKVATELKQFVEENPESQGQNEQSSESQEGSEMSESQDSENQNSEGQKFNSSASSRSRTRRVSEDEQTEQSGASVSGDASDIDGEQSQSQATSGENTDQSESNVKSETQTHFDSAIQKFVDTNTTKTHYANIPQIELDKLIVDYKTVHEQISRYYSSYYAQVYASAQEQVEKFKAANKNTVNQLANLFEMKKKAKLDVRSLTSRTGKLDTNRVHSYRYNDDIFKKLTITPQGKNHGLLMFIDMSSSMTENIAGTYEQLLNLVLFCRRVNIPFDVYGFTDTYCARRNMVKHSNNVGELMFDESFCLRHYFSSRMSGVEFNNALQNIICIMRHYTGGQYAGIPSEETLNTTPMVPTILVCTKLVKQFREQYNLDIVNTIFLTDGEDTHGLMYNDGTNENKYFSSQRRFGWGTASEKYFLRDVKTRKQWEIKNTTSDMLNVLRETTGVKVIGFHIIRKREANYVVGKYVTSSTELDKHMSSFKDHKFCELTNIPGYDAYYLIPSGNNLSVGAEEFESHIDTSIDWEDQKQAKKTMKAVTKDFNNFMKQRVTNRILLNRFIEHIS